MESTATRLADWDLSPFFQDFPEGDFARFRDQFFADVQALQEALDEELTAELLLRWEDIAARYSHLSCYLWCRRSADTADLVVKKELTDFEAHAADLTKLEIAVENHLLSLSESDFEQLLSEPALDGAEFYLRRSRQRGQKRMAPELERLAAELEVDGLAAWGRLYTQLAGNLEFTMDEEKVPMALRRSLLEDPDPRVRRQAFESSNEVWSGVQDTLAACLNGIAGTRLTLYKRRGIKHFLEPALFDSAISRQTLDAMMTAIAENYQVPREYLRLKAQAFGQEQLAFWDLSAPLPLADSKPLEWEEAVKRIRHSFGRLYPDLGSFAEMNFERRWIDYAPRAAKQSGGFCISSEVLRETRIFMTYNKTLGDLQTLAHELGHGFHNWVMRDLRPWSVSYPMTLAETASTFAETMLTDAILQAPEATPLEQVRVLDTRLENAASFLLNIPMRYLFESRFYEERANGEVPVPRLKELMLEAQNETYAEVLDPHARDPYFWASKLHFYITEVSFYNFPYSFGYLFSLGVYARFLKEGPDFLKRYEKMLRATGAATAEEVAHDTLGVDLTRPDFWCDSISLVADDLMKFRELLPQVL